MAYKLGSLFDGSGGFPLAGALCGIEPVWASEVEPYPIAVTRERFPNMKHLGDISKVHGGEIEPVDIITFGSPCQDLSVAGKRAGLKHEANGDEETTRSGLFMEAVRIIKEMRKATNGEYPRFALWENVPGAFSSNSGEDFRIVCEELIKIIEPSASMPPVPQNGWNYADSYLGDGWSLAYRTFDAQYWGVPQRRRRIHLVADFRGERAREILFEREGLRGYFAEGRTPWQTAPEDAQGGSGADDREGEETPRGERVGSGFASVEGDGTGGGRGLQLDAITNRHILDDQGGSVINVRTDGKSPTLRAQMGGHPPVVMVPIAYEPVGYDGAGITSPVNASNPQPGDPYHTLSTDSRNYIVVPVSRLQGNGIDRADTAGCNGKDRVISFHLTQDPIISDKKTPCITAGSKKGQAVVGIAKPICLDRPAVVYAVDQGGGKSSANVSENTAPTLCTTHGGEPAVAYGLDRTCICTNYIVRRLTPTECARLQGFADWWSYVPQKDTLTNEEYRFWLDVRNTHAAINGRAEKDYNLKSILTWYNKLYTDSAEYKMWGNGIALPPALYVMQGIMDALNTTEDDSWML